MLPVILTLLLILTFPLIEEIEFWFILIFPGKFILDNKFIFPDVAPKLFPWTYKFPAITYPLGDKIIFPSKFSVDVNVSPNILIFPTVIPFPDLGFNNTEPDLVDIVKFVPASVEIVLVVTNTFSIWTDPEPLPVINKFSPKFLVAIAFLETTMLLSPICEKLIGSIDKFVFSVATVQDVNLFWFPSNT